MKGRGSIALLLIAATILLRPWDTGTARRLLSLGEGAAGPGASERLAGRVVRAVDGDTLEVRLDDGATETVRLIGVDTPETVKPDTPVQCFGPQASRFEHRTVEGRRVRLLTGVEPRDFYGRLLAYVWVDRRDQPRPADRRAATPGRSLEAELLRRGLARTLPFHPNDRFASRFAELAQKAARAGKGLWNAC
ncbi:MAG: thermonuclease family protein [Actinobacteria bacterium]|nr:thermonuclease family protein [Actinomycetota bacterium]